MYLFVQGPDGSAETLVVQSAADIQVRPGYVYTFLEVDPALVQFQVDAETGKHLIIDLPGRDGPIRLLDFMDILAGDQPASLRWLQDADTVELQAESLNDFMTGGYTFRPTVEGLGDDSAEDEPGDSLGGSLLSPVQAAAVIESFGMLLNAHGPLIEGGSTPAKEPPAITYPDAGVADASPATATITVNPVNDAPVALEDTGITNTDPIIINVLANDSDIEGDSLSVLSVTQPANGGTSINPDNTVTYTPDGIFTNGIDTFTYTVSDCNGGTDNATVYVAVTEESAITGTSGDDTLFGGKEVDVIYGLQGNDTLKGKAKADILDGGEGNDTLTGNRGNDVLFGGDGTDTLNGRKGNDSMFGDSGNDILNGGLGDDILAGGLGSDLLTGGAGTDKFKLATGDLGTGVDTVTDFSTLDSDMLDMSEVITVAGGKTLDDYVLLQDDGAGNVNVHVDLGGAVTAGAEVAFALSGVSVAELGIPEDIVVV